MSLVLLIIRTNYYLILPLLLCWALSLIFAHDTFCNFGSESYDAYSDNFIGHATICRRIPLKKLFALPGKNELTITNQLLDKRGLCDSYGENTSEEDCNVQYYSHLFSGILFLHILIAIIISKFLLAFQRDFDTKGLVMVLDALRISRERNKDSSTFRPLIDLYGSSFKRKGNCCIFYESIGAFFAFVQFYLVWSFSGEEIRNKSLYDEFYVGVQQDPGVKLYTCMSNPFPRVFNCTMDFGLKSFHSVCMKPGNIRNEMYYFLFYYWAIFFAIAVMMREGFKLFRIMIACLGISCLQRFYISSALFPPNMSRYVRTRKIMHNVGIQAELLYFLRIKQLVRDPTIILDLMRAYYQPMVLENNPEKC